jgi:adenosine deaminase CECR1
MVGGCQQPDQSPSSVIEGDVQYYLDQRESLLAKDISQSIDSQLGLDSAELLLNEKLIEMRDSMLNFYKEQHFFPPARYFFQSKGHIEETKLFKIFQKMPKGGILHLHGAASGNAQWVVDRVITEPHAYIYWNDPQDQFVKGQINFYHENEEPTGFKKALQLNEEIPHFKDSLFTLLTFDESIDADSVDIWGEFEAVFQRIYGFVRYQPVFKDYFYHAFEQLVDDGVQHVELRGIFNELYDLQHLAGYYNADSSIRYFQEAAGEIRHKEPAFTLKVIFTALRFKSKEDIERKLVEAFELRKRYPGFISGFDLVAEEDNGHSTLYFLDNWLKLDSLQSVYGVDMPLYLHDGESNWVSVKNLYDAVLLESRRIGHGFNLFRFPNLMEEVKKMDICLEINPISNQVLGFIRDLRLHPGSTYLTRGIPVVISSDDPLIFNYQGLSYDFWEVFLAWELDLRSMKLLALNSLKYSALDDAEREKAMNYFNRNWDLFVEGALVELGKTNYELL